jgi:hypothetical protein
LGIAVHQSSNKIDNFRVALEPKRFAHLAHVIEDEFYLLLVFLNGYSTQMTAVTGRLEAKRRPMTHTEARPKD